MEALLAEIGFLREVPDCALYRVNSEDRLRMRIRKGRGKRSRGLVSRFHARGYGGFHTVEAFPAEVGFLRELPDWVLYKD